jgi:regulator of protease activity HflC (stomatin/prohibitin superfamily)
MEVDFSGSVVCCVFGVMLVLACIFLAASIRIIPGNTRLSVYRLGQYIGDKGPGIVVLIPFIDRGVKKEIGMRDENASNVDDQG